MSFLRNIYLKWALVVCLNAVVGFFIGYRGVHTLFLLGMLAGIFSWYLIYLSLDLYLIKAGYVQHSKRLFLSALLRLPIELTVYPDMFTGALAIETVNALLPAVSKATFIVSYFTTMFTALYLSLMCACIFGLITLVAGVRMALKKP